MNSTVDGDVTLVNLTVKRVVYRILLFVLLVYWLGLFIGTHLPIAAPDGLHVGDKMMHFLGYFGLGFLLGCTILRFRPTLAGALGLLLIVSSYGIADELTQTLVPHRSAEAWDWVADVGGGLAGLAFYSVTQWLCLCWYGQGNIAADDCENLGLAPSKSR